MPVTDAITWLHGTPATPANIFTSTSSQLGDKVLDLGASVSGSAYPYLPEFPSRNEQAYTFPPEVVGDGGIEMGIHLIVSTACTVGSGCTGGTVNASIGAADTLLTTVASRVFTLAQLAVVGAHYFIPVNPAAINLRYLGVQMIATTDAVGAGTGVLWFGPKTGGEQ
jgi:hypothetical protein